MNDTPPTETPANICSADTAPMDRYQVGKKLGGGGFGDVYLAYDRVLHRQVAVKYIQPEKLGDSSARRLFRKEAQAAARLKHAGIVPVYDFIEGEDQDCIVMEYVEGGNLGETFSQPFSATLPLFVHLAQALAHAHANGIVHRDLKPGNVVVSHKEDTPSVKILDFGLAKRIDRDDSSVL